MTYEISRKYYLNLLQALSIKGAMSTRKDVINYLNSYAGIRKGIVDIKIVN